MYFLVTHENSLSIVLRVKYEINAPPIFSYFSFIAFLCTTCFQLEWLWEDICLNWFVPHTHDIQRPFEKGRRLTSAYCINEHQTVGGHMRNLLISESKWHFIGILCVFVFHFVDTGQPFRTIIAEGFFLLENFFFVDFIMDEMEFWQRLRRDEHRILWTRKYIKWTTLNNAYNLIWLIFRAILVIIYPYFFFLQNIVAFDKCIKIFGKK